ncbi:MAG: choice-of-anchor I family protein, partial [Xanthobacteraceae bacterium]
MGSHFKLSGKGWRSDKDDNKTFFDDDRDGFGFFDFFDWGHHGNHHHDDHGNHGPGHGGPDNDDSQIELSLLATFDSALGEGAAEIVAHDPQSQRLFVTNAESETVDILDISDPKNPTKVGSIDVSVVNGTPTGGPNSVAVANGIIAVAVEAEDKTDPGLVAFYDADGNFLGSVQVGALPDMLTFTPDGKKLLVANEGEPNFDDDELPIYAGDAKGSVSIIDLSDGVAAATVKNADFTKFDSKQAELEADGLRIFPGRLLSDDVEPEYIAIAPDGKTAFITLQEANAVAVLDINKGKIVEIQPLGAKDHSKQGNGLDGSDRDGPGNDGTIDIGNQPVLGLYMPDGIASYKANGKTYYVTANEGDDRGETVRIKDIVLDPVKFPNAAELQSDDNIGRLAVSSINGDTDGDGDYDKLYAYGARSFTIWDQNGKKVFDSGDMFEQIIAEMTPELFNADDADPDEFDTRSDAKGPEPESVVVGEVDGKTYAFVGLERAGGGVMIFDITNPKDVEFVQYIRTDGDIAPEGLDFISAKDSAIGVPLLAVANEVSGTTSLYKISFDGKTIKGSNRDDKLEGTGGDDVIDGRGGNDKIFGFAGDDQLLGGDQKDKIFGGFGDDEIAGGKGRDELHGDQGDDLINGGKDDDKLFGGDGDDIMVGGGGNDEHDGGAGIDTVVFSGNRSDYLIDTDNQIVVDLRSGFPDGVDRYDNVEFLEFADETFGLPAFTLELLHFTDQEASTSAIQDAPNLSAVLNALRAQDIGDDGQPDNTLTLSSGDMFIPGVFFGASSAVFGSGGIADIQIQNELGVQAAALGNHEFDFGSAVLAGLISGNASGTILGADFAGTAFPYLSSNLDFATQTDLAALEAAGGGAPQSNTVTSSVVIDVNGEKIGVVGATTPTLPIISSPGTLAVSPTPFDVNPTPDQIDALAAIIQAEVDALLDANPAMNKVILLAHMQQIQIELALAERLENVDIIVAGGSNTRLFDDNDRIRPGDSEQGQYPLCVENAVGTTTVGVNTDGSSKAVGRRGIDVAAHG